MSGGQLLRIESFAARGPRLMPVKTGKSIRATGRLGCLFVGRFARRWSVLFRGNGRSPAQAATIAVVSATASPRRTPPMPGRDTDDRPGQARSAVAPTREAAAEQI
jgi:hypothetical protein